MDKIYTYIYIRYTQQPGSVLMENSTVEWLVQQLLSNAAAPTCKTSSHLRSSTHLHNSTPPGQQHPIYAAANHLHKSTPPTQQITNTSHNRITNLYLWQDGTYVERSEGRYSRLRAVSTVQVAQYNCDHLHEYGHALQLNEVLHWFPASSQR